MSAADGFLLGFAIGTAAGAGGLYLLQVIVAGHHLARRDRMERARDDAMEISARE